MGAIGRVFTGLLALLLLLLGGLVAIGLAYNPNILVEPGLLGQHVAVEGLPIRILEKGRGRPVLLIHGSPGSLEDWTPVMSKLEGSFRVIAYDRPGYGYSGDSGKYGLADNAKVALGLISMLGLERAIVVGHSYGGATALAVALSAPERVASYVIVDASAYTPRRPPEPTSPFLAVPLIGMGFASVAGPMLAPSRIRTGIQDQFRGAPPVGFVEERVAMWSTPKVLHAQALESIGYAEGLAAQSPRYGSIRAPVHVIGQSDDALRKESAERLHKDIHGSTLKLISGAGHYLQIERPDEVSAVIRQAAGEEDPPAAGTEANPPSADTPENQPSAGTQN